MIKSILLPIDGSPYTEAVLDYGDFLAEKFGAILRILTVIDIRLFDWSVATSADSFVPIMPSTEFQEESQRIQNEKAEKVIQKAS
ncbi:universal stress protein, partial [Caldithrix abyssi]